MPAGRDHDLPPSGRAGQHAGRQCRQQTGPHDGRLAAARCADHGQQATLHHSGDELGDEPLAAVEQLGVAGLERGKALVHARATWSPDPRRPWRPPARVD